MTTPDLTDPPRSAAPTRGAPPAAAVPRRWPPERSGRRWLRRLGPAAAACAALVGLTLAYTVMSRSQPVNADGASQALMAWDILQGNVLLSGWTMSDVSFYLTDLVAYVVVEAAYGLGPDVVHRAAAVIYALLVLVTLAVAKGRSRGREAVVRVGLALAIVGVPAAGTGSWVLLLSPDHTGTGVPLLLTWLVLDRGLTRADGSRRGAVARWLPYAIAVLLAWGQVADPLILFIGVLPLVLVCAVRGWRGGGPRRRLGLDGRLVLAGLASVLIAQLVNVGLRLAGGYTTHSPPIRFVAFSGLLDNVRITGQVLGVIFGAYLPDRDPPLAVAAGGLHLLGLLAVLATVAVVAAGALRRVDPTRDRDRLGEVMAVGFLVNVAAFVVSTLPADLTTARQVAVTLPLGAALLGRTAGPWLASRRLATRRLLPAAAAVLLALGGEFAVRTAERPVPAANQDIADWLVANDLTYGVGGFWTANNLTLNSGGRVRVAPITGTSRIWAYRWLSKAEWYDPAHHDARFVVVDRGDRPDEVLRGLTMQFGSPTQRQDFGRFSVLVYDHNLLAGLPAYCFPGVAPSMAECGD